MKCNSVISNYLVEIELSVSVYCMSKFLKHVDNVMNPIFPRHHHPFDVFNVNWASMFFGIRDKTGREPQCWLIAEIDYFVLLQSCGEL